MPDGNRDTRAALAFQAATKYSALRDASDGVEYAMGTLPRLERPICQEDMSIEPQPYKVYTSLQPVELPAELRPTTLPALEALAHMGAEPNPRTRMPEIADLAQLGQLSNGLLNRRVTTQSGRIIEFRYMFVTVFGSRRVASKGASVAR